MTSKKDPFRGFRSARQERLSRRQKEHRKQRIAMGLIASFIILVLGVVMYGYVTTFVLPPRQVIVRVDDTKYTMGDMIQVLRMMQRGSEFFGQKMDLSTVPFQVPLSLAQREIIARAVPRFNINVSEDHIDNEIRSRLLPTVRCRPEPGGAGGGFRWLDGGPDRSGPGADRPCQHARLAVRPARGVPRTVPADRVHQPS